jgi:ubiquinone/menaquinone biosynthesis C-methylase UbiE
MHIEHIEKSFPTVNDYPEEMFNIRMPRGCRVGCGRAYLKANTIARGFFIKRIIEAFRMLPRKEYNSILDLGTGAGFYLPLLSRLSKQVHGVDINPVIHLTQRMLLKKELNNVQLHKADVTQLPFKSDKFDLIFCLSLIEHIKDQEKLLLEFKRVLNKQGTLILGYPLQNLAQEMFEGLNSCIQRAKLFILLPLSESKKQYKELKEFPYHHTSNFRDIKKTAQKIFMLRESVTIKLLGFPVYEILLLQTVAYST